MELNNGNICTDNYYFIFGKLSLRILQKLVNGIFQRFEDILSLSNHLMSSLNLEVIWSIPFIVLYLLFIYYTMVVIRSKCFLWMSFIFFTGVSMYSKIDT